MESSNAEENARPVTIDDISDHVSALHESNAWRQRSSAERMEYLISEVGELAHALIELDHVDKGDPSTAYEHVAEEMVDVIWNICALAIALNINLNTATRQKLAILKERSWDD